MHDHPRRLATVLALMALGCSGNKEPAPATPPIATTVPAASAPPASAAPPTPAPPVETSAPAPATAGTGAVTGTGPAATPPAKAPATGVPTASPAEKKAPPAPAKEPASSAKAAQAPASATPAPAASAPPAPATKASPAGASAVAEPAPPKAAHAAVGATKCRMCHKVQFESWSASAHAAKGLDCEGCHGNGADYARANVMRDRAASIAAGMIVPDVSSCRKCHPAADASLLPRAHAHKPG